MTNSTDTLKRALLIVEDLTGSGLQPHEQFNVLDLAALALRSVHWQPAPPVGEAPPPPLRGKNLPRSQ
jgi:hypothetical protein